MSEEECVLDEQGVESFESLYEKLMVVVERLEVGGLSLEESIGLYAVSYTHLTLPTNREV